MPLAIPARFPLSFMAGLRNHMSLDTGIFMMIETGFAASANVGLLGEDQALASCRKSPEIIRDGII